MFEIYSPGLCVSTPPITKYSDGRSKKNPSACLEREVMLEKNNLWDLCDVVLKWHEFGCPRFLSHDSEAASGTTSKPGTGQKLGKGLIHTPFLLMQGRPTAGELPILSDMTFKAEGSAVSMCLSSSASLLRSRPSLQDISTHRQFFLWRLRLRNVRFMRLLTTSGSTGT